MKFDPLRFGTSLVRKIGVRSLREKSLKFGVGFIHMERGELANAFPTVQVLNGKLKRLNSNRLDIETPPQTFDLARNHGGFITTYRATINDAGGETAVDLEIQIDTVAATLLVYEV